MLQNFENDFTDAPIKRMFKIEFTDMRYRQQQRPTDTAMVQIAQEQCGTPI